MSQFAWTFPGGKLKQEVTSVELVNATTKTIDVLVPAGKIWILLSFKIVNGDDVSRVCYCEKFKEAAATNFIKRYVTETLVALDRVHWPHPETGEYNIQTDPAVPAELCAAGNILRFVWETGGASTGATDADGLVVEYLEIDVP